MINDKIMINLLPPELAIVQKEKNKKKWVVRISSLIIATAAIITASTLGFGILKNKEHQALVSQIEQFRQNITSFNQQEGYLTLIRQKLVTINKLKIEDSSKVATLDTFLELVPSSVKIISTTLDRVGEISFSGQADSLSNLNLLVQNFTDPSKNSDKISKVKFDSLSKDSANLYRFDMTIILK